MPDSLVVQELSFNQGESGRGKIATKSISFSHPTTSTYSNIMQIHINVNRLRQETLANAFKTVITCDCHRRWQLTNFPETNPPISFSEFYTEEKEQISKVRMQSHVDKSITLLFLNLNPVRVTPSPYYARLLA